MYSVILILSNLSSASTIPNTSFRDPVLSYSPCPVLPNLLLLLTPPTHQKLPCESHVGLLTQNEK